MSATNHTTNYELPIFVGSDKPAWLVDWNGAMTAIDTALHQVEVKADQAGTDIGGIESSISTINSTLTSINSAVSQLRIDTNANTGSINTITSLIGNGEPTTTDKTIIGAINEINAGVAGVEDLLTLALSTDSPTISSTGTVDSTETAMKVLKSTAGNFLKCFGRVRITNITLQAGARHLIATLTNTGLTIPAQFTVTGYDGEIRWDPDFTASARVELTFNTDGSVGVYIANNLTSALTLTSVLVQLPPCLLINSVIE